MLLYVIRHGETDANVQGLTQGWIDSPLNENGIKLAKITGRAMKGIHFDRCITSPLKRAYKTVELVLKESGNENTEISVDERIKEYSFGINEGQKLYSGILSKEETDIYYSDTLNFKGFPEGETIRHLCDRTQEFLKELCKRDDGLTYLIGIHGCAVRAMLNFLYDDPSDFWHGHVPYNCSVNIIEAKNGEIKLLEDDKIFYDKKYIVDRYVNDYIAVKPAAGNHHLS